MDESQAKKLKPHTPRHYKLHAASHSTRHTQSGGRMFQNLIAFHLSIPRHVTFPPPPQRSSFQGTKATFIAYIYHRSCFGSDLTMSARGLATCRSCGMLARRIGSTPFAAIRAISPLPARAILGRRYYSESEVLDAAQARLGIAKDSVRH